MNSKEAIGNYSIYTNLYVKSINFMNSIRIFFY